MARVPRGTGNHKRPQKRTKSTASAGKVPRSTSTRATSNGEVPHSTALVVYEPPPEEEVREEARQEVKVEPPPPEAGPAEDSGQPPPPTPEELQAAIDAMVMARDSNLIDRLREDMAAVGLVGEEDNGLLTLVCYTSRILKRPVSLLIRGGTSTGKDIVQRVPARLIPPEDVIAGSSITPQAFYYGHKGWLRHKVILGGERKHQKDEAQKDATAALRMLLSNGCIDKIVTLNISGVLVTKRIHQDGPVSYSETTTAGTDSIFREDINRMVQLYTDESEKQNADVCNAIGAEYDPDAEDTDEQALVLKHQMFQRSLAPMRVSVPYWRKLVAGLPKTDAVVRRVVSQVLGVIEAVALLHQHQRQPNDRGRLVATLEDYRVARQLLLEPMHHAIGLKGDYRTLKDVAGKLPPGVFTTKQAQEAWGIKFPMQVSRILLQLVTLKVIEPIKAGTSHRPGQWRWTGKHFDELVLPRVETVAPIMA
jgi:hypothetical protein